MARGFDETWGRLRNSSRSIVPELSYTSQCTSISTHIRIRATHVLTLSSFINRLRRRSTSSRSTSCESQFSGARMVVVVVVVVVKTIQFDPETMLSISELF